MVITYDLDEFARKNGPELVRVLKARHIWLEQIPDIVQEFYLALIYDSSIFNYARTCSTASHWSNYMAHRLYKCAILYLQRQNKSKNDGPPSWPGPYDYRLADLDTVVSGSDSTCQIDYNLDVCHWENWCEARAQEMGSDGPENALAYSFNLKQDKPSSRSNSLYRAFKVYKRMYTAEVLTGKRPTTTVIQCPDSEKRKDRAKLNYIKNKAYYQAYYKAYNASKH